MGSQVKANSDQSVGSGEFGKRVAATILGFGPLALSVYALQVYSQGNWSSLVRPALFVATLLQGSFAYDVLKSFLVLPRDRFLEVWVQVQVLSISLIIFLVVVVIIALVPTKNLGWHDASFALLFSAIGLIFSVCTVKAFVKAVLLAAR